VPPPRFYRDRCLRAAGRLFRVSADQLDAINFAGLLLYETAILVFNRAVPRPADHGLSCRRP
jgi:hypothetical protein